MSLIKKTSQYRTNKAIISLNALIDFVKFFLPPLDCTVGWSEKKNFFFGTQ